MLVQFAVSIFMIVGTAIVYNQIDHMKSRELGFDKENIVHISTGDALRGGKVETIKRQLLQHPGVIGVTVTNAPPVRRETNAGAGDVHWEGKQAGQRVPVHVMAVDYDYLETFKMEMAEGRFLSQDYSTDAADGYCQVDVRGARLGPVTCCTLHSSGTGDFMPNHRGASSELSMIGCS